MEGRTADRFERYAWISGIVFVAALMAESIVAIKVGLTHDDPAAKVRRRLDEHHDRLVVITCLSVIYAPMFLVYVTGLHDLFRRTPGSSRILTSCVLIGGTLLIAMHGVSDIGITGLLGAKVATYSAAHHDGLSYALYYVTFVVDSAGDVFGSVFLIGAGVMAVETRLLPRWLGAVAVASGVLLFAQGFGLGGVIGTFGLVVDGIGFLLFLVFVLASSIVLLRRGSDAGPQTP